VSNPIRLLIVDSQTLLRRCLIMFLNRRRGLEVVGEAATGAEAQALAQALQPDVAIVEPGLPDGGADLVAGLVLAAPTCAVLVLAVETRPDAASRMLGAGARGYLQKTCEPDDVVQAVERVHRGELVVASQGAETVLSELSGESTRGAGPDALSPREFDVLRLITQGQTNSEIARELSITEHTVKGHLGKILAKLGLDNRVQVATYAVQQGLDSLAEPSAARAGRRP
jgi:NarL family two-component system response regulator LiaR